MIKLGQGLMLPTPVRPREVVLHRVQRCQHQLPAEVANLGDAQMDLRPRRALNARKLLVLDPVCLPFFGRSLSIAAARTTAKNACAHIANVICRYHPVQLRTS